MLRVLVCGGRDFADRDLFDATMAQFEGREITIIHGKADGADAMADEWARVRWLNVLGFRALWDKYGKAAGPIRNELMLDKGQPDLVVAFPGGAGTADMVRRAEAAGIRVVKVAPSPPQGTGGRS